MSESTNCDDIVDENPMLQNLIENGHSVPRSWMSLNWSVVQLSCNIKDSMSKTKFLSLHHQVYQIYQAFVEVDPIHTMKLVAKLFKFQSVNAVRYHLKKYREDMDKITPDGHFQSIKHVGRPTLISENDLDKIRTFIDESYLNRELLTFKMVHTFMNDKLKISICLDTLRRILHDRDILKIIPAQPIEPSWFNIKGGDINDYFEKN